MEHAKPHFVVNGKKYSVPNDLTLGEMCDAEQFFGVEFGSNATPGIRMAAAMLWIAIRRVDATVKVEDIRALPPDVFATLDAEDAARPPDENADESAKSVSSGERLSNGSADPVNPLQAIGNPGSDTTVASDPMISAA